MGSFHTVELSTAGGALHRKQTVKVTAGKEGGQQQWKENKQKCSKLRRMKARTPKLSTHRPSSWAMMSPCVLLGGWFLSEEPVLEPLPDEEDEDEEVACCRPPLAFSRAATRAVRAAVVDVSALGVVCDRERACLRPSEPLLLLGAPPASALDCALVRGPPLSMAAAAAAEASSCSLCSKALSRRVAALRLHPKISLRVSSRPPIGAPDDEPAAPLPGAAEAEEVEEEEEVEAADLLSTSAASLLIASKPLGRPLPLPAPLAALPLPPSPVRALRLPAAAGGLPVPAGGAVDPEDVEVEPPLVSMAPLVSVLSAGSWGVGR